MQSNYTGFVSRFTHRVTVENRSGHTGFCLLFLHDGCHQIFLLPKTEISSTVIMQYIPHLIKGWTQPDVSAVWDLHEQQLVNAFPSSNMNINHSQCDACVLSK